MNIKIKCDEIYSNYISSFNRSTSPKNKNFGSSSGSHRSHTSTRSAASIRAKHKAELLRLNILNHFEAYKINNLQVDSKGLEHYSRKSLTLELSKILIN